MSIVVLISGNGTNLQALIDAQRQGQFGSATINLVVSNKADAYGLKRAEAASIPTRVFSLKDYRQANPDKTRKDYDAELASLISRICKPDLIVLAGFMHILSRPFLDHFRTAQLINLHPALPGQFDGAKAIERAYEAFRAKKITQTGVMIHKVVEEVDQGEVIVKEALDMIQDETLEQLEERVHQLERRLIVQGVIRVLSSIQSSK